MNDFALKVSVRHQGTLLIPDDPFSIAPCRQELLDLLAQTKRVLNKASSAKLSRQCTGDESSVREVATPPHCCRAGRSLVYSTILSWPICFRLISFRKGKYWQVNHSLQAKPTSPTTRRGREAHWLHPRVCARAGARPGRDYFFRRAIHSRINHRRLRQSTLTAA